MAIISIIPKYNTAKIYIYKDIYILYLIFILKGVLGKERVIISWLL
jgi:hypothetical protein